MDPKVNSLLTEGYGKGFFLNKIIIESLLFEWVFFSTSPSFFKTKSPQILVLYKYKKRINPAGPCCPDPSCHKSISPGVSMPRFLAGDLTHFVFFNDCTCFKINKVAII